MVNVEVVRISYYPPSKGYAVLLREIDGDRQIPIIVGSSEAQAIALALEGINMPRPMTHDLICDFLDDLQADVLKVVVTHISKGTFYAKVVIDTPYLGTVKVDSRPSDALAVGLRAMAPIYISDVVMKEAAVENMVFEEGDEPIISEDPIQMQKNTLNNLKAALDKAVDDEDYEVAAKLRDRIKFIEKKSETPK